MAAHPGTTTYEIRSMKTAARNAMVVNDDYHAKPRSGVVVGINIIAHPCPPDFARVLRLGDDLGQRNKVAHSSASTRSQNAAILQQTQPLVRLMVSPSWLAMRAASMLMLPKSLTRIAKRKPWSPRSRELSTVVLPAPRRPRHHFAGTCRSRRTAGPHRDRSKWGGRSAKDRFLRRRPPSIEAGRNVRCCRCRDDPCARARQVRWGVGRAATRDGRSAGSKQDGSYRRHTTERGADVPARTGA